MSELTRQSTPDRRPIGYTVTMHWCRDCVPEGVRDGYNPMRVGDDQGIPYSCDVCGEQMLPCDHEWDEWRLAYTPEGQPPRDIRFCTKQCGEADYRPHEEASHVG